MPRRADRRPLASLLYHKGGSTLAMMAAAIFPLAGLAGGALDMSRTYLVKSRLQQACDAGVLAGRRVMTGASVTADANAMTQAQNFFNVNLAQGAYGARLGTFAVSDVREGGVPTGNVTGRVAGTATATVPMSLMRIFGYDEIEVLARCEANLNVANNDIMFVLDLTGSMGCRPTGDSACFVNPTQVGGVWQVPTSAGSKIAALRTAVSQFYTTLSNATPDSARLRFAFVPYSSSVNVGAIMPAGSMQTTPYGYRSREANFETPEQVPTTTPTSAWIEQTYNGGELISQAECNSYGANQAFGKSFKPNPAGNTPNSPHAINGNVVRPADSNGVEYKFTSWTGGNNNNKVCKRERRTTRTTWATRYAFTNWVYGNFEFDISSDTYSYVTLPTAYPTDRADPASTARTTIRVLPRNPQQLAAMVANGTAIGMPATITETWDGCIEERNDHADIDGPATSETTQWRPTRRGFMHRSLATPTAVGSQPLHTSPTPTTTAPWTRYSCTMPSRRLAPMTQTEVDAYVNNPRFAPNGSTYHDIGMIWATRMMSRNSVFAADHAVAAPNGRETRRHIIFMTDGDMQPDPTGYGTFGMDDHERRVSTTATTPALLTAAHNQRYAAACNYARNTANISVWVVAFGQTLTPQMTACANPGQARQANDPEQLQRMFQEIAQQLAELRLSE